MSDNTEENLSASGYPFTDEQDRPPSAELRTEGDDQTDLMAPGEDMQSLMDAQDARVKSLQRRQTVKGVVVSVSEDTVLVDVGTKSEGYIPPDELAEEGEERPHLEYGQEILVQVLEPESHQGPVLSLKRAQRDQAWVDMEAYVETGQVVSAAVVDHNRGGALVDVRGLRGFIPLSQLASLGPPGQSSENGEDTQDRLARLHGQRLNLKVLEASRQQNRLILSERAAEQEQRALRRAEVLADLQPGQIRHGRIRNVTGFGAFVDLGGADGLVHVSEMSYERVQNPRAIVEPGQEVDVYVLDVNPDDQRIALSLKRAMADPWDSLVERRQPGEVVEVTITRLTRFGAFAQVEPGVEGLIHLSELAEVSPSDPKQVVHEGQKVQAKIIHIDRVQRRLGLSLRQMAPEVDMTLDEYIAGQESESAPQPSGFEALSELADTLPEAGPEPPNEETVDASAPVILEGEEESEVAPVAASDEESEAAPIAASEVESDVPDTPDPAGEVESEEFVSSNEEPAVADNAREEEASQDAESDDAPEAINAASHAT